MSSHRKRNRISKLASVSVVDAADPSDAISSNNGEENGGEILNGRKKRTSCGNKNNNFSDASNQPESCKEIAVRRSSRLLRANKSTPQRIDTTELATKKSTPIISATSTGSTRASSSRVVEKKVARRAVSTSKVSISKIEKAKTAAVPPKKVAQAKASISAGKNTKRSKQSVVVDNQEKVLINSNNKNTSIVEQTNSKIQNVKKTVTAKRRTQTNTQNTQNNNMENAEKESNLKQEEEEEKINLAEDKDDLRSVMNLVPDIVFKRPEIPNKKRNKSENIFELFERFQNLQSSMENVQLPDLDNDIDFSCAKILDAAQRSIQAVANPALDRIDIAQTINDMLGLSRSTMCDELQFFDKQMANDLCALDLINPRVSNDEHHSLERRFQIVFVWLIDRRMNGVIDQAEFTATRNRYLRGLEVYLEKRQHHQPQMDSVIENETSSSSSAFSLDSLFVAFYVCAARIVAFHREWRQMRCDKPETDYPSETLISRLQAQHDRIWSLLLQLTIEVIVRMEEGACSSGAPISELCDHSHSTMLLFTAFAAKHWFAKLLFAQWISPTQPWKLDQNDDVSLQPLGELADRLFDSTLAGGCSMFDLTRLAYRLLIFENTTDQIDGPNSPPISWQSALDLASVLIEMTPTTATSGPSSQHDLIPHLFQVSFATYRYYAVMDAIRAKRIRAEMAPDCLRSLRSALDDEIIDSWPKISTLLKARFHFSHPNLIRGEDLKLESKCSEAEMDKSMKMDVDDNCGDEEEAAEEDKSSITTFTWQSLADPKAFVKLLSLFNLTSFEYLIGYFANGERVKAKHIEEIAEYFSTIRCADHVEILSKCCSIKRAIQAYAAPP